MKEIDKFPAELIKDIERIAKGAPDASMLYKVAKHDACEFVHALRSAGPMTPEKHHELMAKSLMVASALAAAVLADFNAGRVPLLPEYYIKLTGRTVTK